MELRLPCIKPPKLYSVDGNRSIRRSYKSDVKGVKNGYFSFLGTATLSEATEQAVFSGYTCGCHIGKTNKQRRSQRPWNGYHNLSLQWMIAMSYSFHKHSNWYCYNHSDWLVSLLYLGNQRPNHRPLPMLSVRLLGRQPMIKGRPRNPNFHLIELLVD